MPSNYGILDFAKAHMPATIEALESEQPGRADMVLAAVKGRMLPTTVLEESLSAFAADYLGKAVAVALVPAGIDHWAVNSRRTRGIDRAAGVIGGTERADNYDRVSALEKLRKQLLAELEADLGSYIGDVGAVPPGLTVTRGIRVSTDGQAKLTQTPDVIGRAAPRARPFMWLDDLMAWESIT